jgi:hypothetical protein
VQAPVLHIVGERDSHGRQLNEAAAAAMTAPVGLEAVPGENPQPTLARMQQ